MKNVSNKIIIQASIYNIIIKVVMQMSQIHKYHSKVLKTIVLK